MNNPYSFNNKKGNKFNSALGLAALALMNPFTYNIGHSSGFLGDSFIPRSIPKKEKPKDEFIKSIDAKIEKARKEDEAKRIAKAQKRKENEH